VLSQYQRDLPRYFRRYAIGNVFRAENPQKGRYREFRQCDIDIFGSTDPLADAEIVACTWFAFDNVGFPEVRIRINDRRSLVAALEPFATSEVDVFSIIRSIDKLDKLRRESVISELVAKGLAEASAGEALEAVRQSTPSAELEAVLGAVRGLGVPGEALEFSPMLARGLDYYTGAIFEVYVPGFSSGSLAGGGRYDDLIEQLGGPKMPAVGIAFGFDRMIEAARHFELTPAGSSAADVLVTVFDDSTADASLAAAAAVREAGIACEVYPSRDKLGKQFKLADQKKIPLVLVIGPDEAAAGNVTVRDMKSGDQESVPASDVAARVQALLARPEQEQGSGRAEG
jgi:histidyl-tRNA synthetase